MNLKKSNSIFFVHQIGQNCHVSYDDNIDVPFKGFENDF